MNCIGYAQYNNKGLSRLTQYMLDQYTHERFNDIKTQIASCVRKLEAGDTSQETVDRDELLYLLLNEMMYTRFIANFNDIAEHIRNGLRLMKLMLTTIHADKNTTPSEHTKNLLGYVQQFVDKFDEEMFGLSEMHAAGTLGLISVFGPVDAENYDYDPARAEHDAELLLKHLTGECGCGKHGEEHSSNTVVDAEGNLHADEL